MSMFIKKEFNKIASLIKMFKFLPKSIYFIASVAMIFSFIAVVAEYTFAMLLQVYLHLLGFISVEQIAPFLRPLAKSVTLPFIILIGALILRGICIFVQTYVNIAFAQTFIYENRKALLYSLFKPDSSWRYDLGTTSNIMAEVIPKGASFMSSFSQFFTLSIQTLGLGIVCLLSLPRESIISFSFFIVIAPLIIFLNRKTRNYGYKLLQRSHDMNIQLMKSIKNFVFIKILGIEKLERDKTITLAKDYYQQYLHNEVYRHFF